MYLLKEKNFPPCISKEELRSVKQFYGIRRMPEYFLSLLNSVHKMELSEEEKNEMGIIYVSHLGPIQEVYKYVDDLLTFPPEECSPANFSHSVFNAPLACVTKYLKLNGSSLCVCGFQNIIDSSVMSAYAWLKTGYCKKLLLIYSDNISDIGGAISDLTGLSLFSTTHILLLSDTEPYKNAPAFPPHEMIKKIKQQFQLGDN